MRTTPFLIVAALAVAGCGTSDREARIARARAETRRLAASLDRLEERLLAGQARVHMWQELRSRHERVSAIACASQEAHAIAMELHAMPAEEGRPGSAPPAHVAVLASGPARPARHGEAPQ